VSPLDPMPETTPDRCITPSFSPSTYYHGKLMDGELRIERAQVTMVGKLMASSMRLRRPKTHSNASSSPLTSVFC